MRDMRDIIEKAIAPLAALLAVVGVVMAWAGGSKHEVLLREASAAQSELNASQVRRVVYQRLAQDLVAYSQAQPAIDAVLVPFGFKAAPNQAGAGQPAPAQPQTPAANPQPTR